MVLAQSRATPRSHVEFVPSLELGYERMVFLIGLLEQGRIRCRALKRGTLFHDDLIPERLELRADFKGELG
jgi:hypothetical protein